MLILTRQNADIKTKLNLNFECLHKVWQQVLKRSEIVNIKYGNYNNIRLSSNACTQPAFLSIRLITDNS